MAALFLWFALLLIPIAVVAALIAYAAFRWQLWGGRQSFSCQRDLFRDRQRKLARAA